MSRALKIGGTVAAVGAGYYFYQAGGDPKAAQKRFEADAAKLQHAGKNDASSKGTEIRKDAEVFAADAGKEVDRLAAQARDGTHKVDQKLEEYRQKAEKNIDSTIQKTGTELNKAVDAFDKNVGQGAEKAKSGISSWLGGSKYNIRFHSLNTDRNPAAHQVLGCLTTPTPRPNPKINIARHADKPSEACTRAPKVDGATGASNAHFPCLSFQPSSTTAAGAASSLSFSLLPQETSSAFSTSVTVPAPQPINSTSDSTVATLTLFTTLRGNDQATSTSSQESAQTMTNATLSATITSNTVLSQNSTTDSRTYIPIASLPKHGGSTANVTMFPVVLHTMAYTTMICPSGGWVG
ncbi:hypothetical protein Q7P35_007240 [Cladosporium inversicolor]